MNEDPTDKYIRELKEENDRLKKAIASGNIDSDFIDEDGDGIDDRRKYFCIFYKINIRKFLI